jgi:DNA-binding FadR family transcriptional regulator
MPEQFLEGNQFQRLCLCLAAMFDYFELDLQFHMTIQEATGNKLIRGILVNLVDKIRWIRRGSADTGRKAPSWKSVKSWKHWKRVILTARLQRCASALPVEFRPQAAGFRGQPDVKLDI